MEADYYVRYTDDGRPIALFRTLGIDVYQWSVHQTQWVRMSPIMWDFVSMHSSLSFGTSPISEDGAIALRPKAVDRDDAYSVEYGFGGSTGA